MPRLTARLRDAYAAFREGKRLRTADVVDATVRPWEETRTRYHVAQAYAELLTRFSRLPKIASSRNAIACASTPLRVYRVKSGGRKSAWQTKQITRGQWRSLLPGAGVRARKALDAGAENIEEITEQEHPLVKLLREVNPRSNTFELIETTQHGVGLTGNGYIAKVRDESGQGPPTELWTLPPQHVEIIPDRQSNTMVGGYRYGRSYEIERVYKPTDVIHVLQYNPFNPYYGMGDLVAMLSDVDLSNQFNEAAHAMLKNGAQPGLIVSGKDIATREVAKQMESVFNGKHTGAFNWFRTMFLWRDVKVDKLDVTEGAVKFLLEPSRAVKELVAAGFDMPVSVLLADESSLASSSSQEPRWKKTAIVPRLRRIEDKLNEDLVPEFEGFTEGQVFVRFDNPVEEDMDALYTRVSTAVTADWMTPNDARRAVGLDPLEDETADQLKRQMPVPDPFGGGGFGNGDDLGGGGGKGDEAAEAEGGKRLVRGDDPPQREGVGGGVLSGRGGVAHHGGGGEQPGDDAGHSKGHARLILPFTKALRTAKGTDAWLMLHGSERCCKDDDRLGRHRRKRPGDAGLERAIAAWMRDAGAVVAAALTEGRPMDSVTEELGRTFAQATGEPIEEVFGDGFNEGIERVLAVRPQLAETAVSFDLKPQRAMDFLAGYRIRLKDSVMDSVSGRVNQVLQESLGEGGSIADATTALRAEFDHLSGYAAERIARTETSRAYGAGNVAGWRELPGVTHKQWLLSSAPCEMCADLYARRPVVRLEEPFARVGETFGGVMVTYADVQTATLHPNDSCAVTFKFEDEVEG